MRFAIGCGLNSIDSLAISRKLSLIPPCVDLLQLGEKINMFWTLFCLDRVGSLVSGLPCAITDEASYPCISVISRLFSSCFDLFNQTENHDFVALSFSVLSRRAIFLLTHLGALYILIHVLAHRRESCSSQGVTLQRCIAQILFQ